MPEDKGFIDFRAVKAAVTMEQVLEHYGLSESLRPLGDDSLTGCCPIHKGTNPTQFRVSRSKNCWKCFSTCHCGGNVLDFISRMEEVAIHRAAHLAAEWFSIDLSSPTERPTGKIATGQPQSHRREAVGTPLQDYKQNSEADSTVPNSPLAFELKHLDPHHPYFTERGLDPGSVTAFGLGHCKKGILSGRIAIPIHNGNGEIVAYAGRWPGQPPGDKPKYQIPKGFRKSLEVFNLHRARQENAETPLIVVEGFFDCMKVWQAGFPRVVALMGSTLAPRQEEQIAELVGTKGQLALMLDEDSAGLSARAHALQRFASRAYVRVIELRNFGRQPDELSKEQLQDLLLKEDPIPYEPAAAKFSLGLVAATPNALRKLTEQDIRVALTRHHHGDWGAVDEHDRQENELSLKEKFRLLSVYKTSEGTKFWIITEADRSATTILMPEDY